MVQETRPDIVLCDIGLPDLDGYAVARHIREEVRDSPPLLVALTGYGTAADRARALAAGFDEHVVKPVLPEVVVRLVERVRH
jgi:CheY-like chemotaxis protein